MARAPLRFALALALLALASASLDVARQAVDPPLVDPIPAAPEAPPAADAAPAAAEPATAPAAAAAFAASKNRMQKPEITTAGLIGLLVGFMFLAIFIPGFMCLWNIQPPQTFEVVEGGGSDVRKKMQ